MPNWFQSKVIEKKVWTDGLFTITVDGSGVKEFQPGQFLHLAGFPNGIANGADEEAREKARVNRPYSVASPHGDQLEFFIVRVDDGELTPHLWNLEVGDEIEVSDKAAGRFTLEKTPDAENLWLIATESADGTLKGRIPNLVEDGSLEKEAGCNISADRSSVLLCGNPAMLDSMEEILGQRSMLRHRSKAPGQIVLERYW